MFLCHDFVNGVALSIIDTFVMLLQHLFLESVAEGMKGFQRKGLQSHVICLLPQFHESLAPFYTYVKYVWMICSDRMISRVHARILTIASDPPCLRTYLLYPCQAIDQTTQSIFFQLTCGIIIFDEVAWVLLVHMQVGNEKS